MTSIWKTVPRDCPKTVIPLGDRLSGNVFLPCVIPAKAGIQTSKSCTLDSCFRRNDIKVSFRTASLSRGMTKNAFSVGLTLIEVLIALAIFTMAFLVMVDAQNITIRNSRTSHRMTIATLLAQQKMSETLLKYQGKALLEIPEKEEGEFEREFQKFRWERTSQDFHYDLSFLVDMAQSGKEEGEEDKPSPLTAALPRISEFIQQSTKEITVTVIWKEGRSERQFSITTHLFDFKTPISL